MSVKVETVKPTEEAESAWQQMKRKSIHHLVVLDGNEVAGVVSDRDLGGRRAEEYRRGRTVFDLMSTPVVAAAPDMTLREAANLMRGRSFGCLPVVKRRRLVGIITVSDLLEQLGRGSMRPIEKSEPWTLRRRAPKMKRALVHERARR